MWMSCGMIRGGRIGGIRSAEQRHFLLRAGEECVWDKLKAPAKVRGRYMCLPMRLCPLLSFCCDAKCKADANCVARAERNIHLVRDWREELACWRDEVVRGGCAGRRTAPGWGLLAHGVGGRYCGASADAGDRVGAVQAGDRREIAGAATEFLSDESAYPGGRVRGHSLAGRNRPAYKRGGEVDPQDAAGTRGGCAPRAETQAAGARLLRSLAESEDQLAAMGGGVG